MRVRSPFGGVARSHARAAGERRRESERHEKKVFRPSLIRSLAPGSPKMYIDKRIVKQLV